jgi:hypothetical protein
VAAWVVLQRAPRFEPALQVEAGRLEAIAVYPDPETALLSRHRFRLGKQARAEPLAANVFGNEQQFDEQPIVLPMSPKPAIANGS